MRLLWSKSKLPLSVFIRKGLNEPCSHFLLHFEGVHEIYQSNLLGVGLEFEKTFLKGAEIVYAIDLPLDQDTRKAVRLAILEYCDGKTYDYGAFAYFIWRAFLNRVFRITYPPSNLWASDGGMLCVGLAKALDTDGVPTWLRECVRELGDCEMMSPERLYAKILEAQEKSKQTTP